MFSFFFFLLYFQYHLVFRRVFSVGIFVTRFFSLSFYSPLYSRSLSPFLLPLSLFSHKLKLYTIKYLAYITVFRITNPMYIYLFDFVSASFPSHNHKSRGKKKKKLKLRHSRVDARQFLLFSEIFLLRGASFALLGGKKKSASNSYYTPCLVQTCRQVPFSRYSDFLISSYSNEHMRVTINTNLSFTVNYRICNHITSRLLRYIV